MSRCKGQELSDLILTDMETGGDGFADFDKCYAGQGHNSGNSPDYMNTSGSNNTIPNNRQGNYVGFAQNGTLIGLPFPNVPNGGGGSGIDITFDNQAMEGKITTATDVYEFDFEATGE